jgi:hypothetical protein
MRVYDHHAPRPNIASLTQRLEVAEAKVEQQAKTAATQSNPPAQALPAADQPQAADPAPEAPRPDEYPAQDPDAQGPPHILGIPYVPVAAPANANIKVKDPEQLTGNRIKVEDWLFALRKFTPMETFQNNNL